MSKQPKDIRIKAMDLLARREHSARELREKLRQRFPDQQGVCDQVVADLRDEGLQSDARFVESFIRLRVSRGHGPVKITAELRQRGIEGELLSASMAGSGFDWFELAQRAALKRFGELPPQDGQERARRMRFLAQRGFSQDQIREALG